MVTPLLLNSRSPESHVIPTRSARRVGWKRSGHFPTNRPALADNRQMSPSGRDGDVLAAVAEKRVIQIIHYPYTQPDGRSYCDKIGSHRVATDASPYVSR